MLTISTASKIPGDYSIDFSPKVSTKYDFKLFQGTISEIKTTGSIVGDLTLKAGSFMNI